MQGIEEIPAWLADAWGINLGTAQVIISIIVIFAILLPTMYLSQDKHQLPVIISLFLGEMLLVGIGWLPFWILIATVAVVVMSIALLGTKMVTGE